VEEQSFQRTPTVAPVRVAGEFDQGCEGLGAGVVPDGHDRRPSLRTRWPEPSKKFWKRRTVGNGRTVHGCTPMAHHFSSLIRSTFNRRNSFFLLFRSQYSMFSGFWGNHFEEIRVSCSLFVRNSRKYEIRFIWSWD
jgi:hypothetical protein